MKDKEREFFNAVTEFCTESMKWCSQESEAATIKVNDIITILVDDASRISAVSKDTLEAINSMRELINNLAAEGNREVANDLARALNQSAKEDQQIESFVSPIIESLQFQDRITQNMYNLIKITKVWLKMREKMENFIKVPPEELIAFGEEMLNCTTMIEERDLIRAKIKGLSQEEAPKDVLFF